jgi:hypothetical protein
MLLPGNSEMGKRMLFWFLAFSWGQNVLLSEQDLTRLCIRCDGKNALIDSTCIIKTSNLRLRGGSESVLPPPGPPSNDGKLKSCAQCGALETRTTLGRCLITELYFCAKSECRKQHWNSNKDFWRERAAKVCIKSDSRNSVI